MKRQILLPVNFAQLLGRRVIRSNMSVKGQDSLLFAYPYMVATTAGYRSSRPDLFCKNVFLKTLTKFTGKHLCSSICFNKVAGVSL